MEHRAPELESAVGSHPASTSERAPAAYARLATPDHHYLEGEPIRALFQPADAARFHVVIEGAGRRCAYDEVLERNCLDIKAGLPQGSYRLRVRYAAADREPDDGPSPWSEWSIIQPIEVHSQDDAERVRPLRAQAHQLSLVLLRDVHGIVTVADPWAFPPAAKRCANDCLWFRTPVYEGLTTLFNEVTEYYRDPHRYFLDAITMLREGGFRFRSWHDVLAHDVDPDERSVILQFDMDGGPRSMNRIIESMLDMNVVASVMVHRECFDWYEYRIEEMDLSMLQRAESRGWTIGYHNNTIGNVQRMDRAGDYSSDVMNRARQRFIEDVAQLRKHFDIRCYTNHGGNVLNYLLAAPPEANVVWVDRGNSDLWKPIRAMFSDGGFLARPRPLHEWIRHLATRDNGMYFFRCHPNKYGNFSEPWDVPPIDPEEAVRRSQGSQPDQLRRLIESECRKQQCWLDHRRRWRLGQVFSNNGPDKPISRRFTDEPNVQQLIDRFRRRRKEVFLREYPAEEGDPRVFWWKLLRHFGPLSGEVLNVGALPPESRDETTEFLAASVSVKEMDIDAARRPDFLCDITELPDELHDRFSGVLLFGLPYIHSPGRALESCRDALVNGGVGLFGFPDEMHPRRGAAWHPHTRPLWRREREPLENIGLRGNLWSFDRSCLEDLFRNWSQVTIENHSDYWFAVCRK